MDSAKKLSVLENQFACKGTIFFLFPHNFSKLFLQEKEKSFEPFHARSAHQIEGKILPLHTNKIKMNKI